MTWRVEEGGRRLRVAWKETGGREVAPPAKPGFGTRLIDMNIERELGGTIVRRYRSNRLEIEIEVPLETGSRQQGRRTARADTSPEFT